MGNCGSTRDAVDKRKPHVILVGSGFAGNGVMSVLSREQALPFDLTIVDKNENLSVAGTWQFVWSNRLKEAPVWPLDKLVFNKHGKTRYGGHKATVQSIDKENKKVFFEDESSLSYSSLVLAPGLVSDPSLVPGLAESNAIDICSLRHVTTMRERVKLLVQNREPQTVMVLVTKLPYNFPPAPFECASLLHQVLQTYGDRSNTRIILALPVGFPFGGTAAMVLFCDLLQQMQIEYWPNHSVSGVETHPDTRTTVDFSVLNNDTTSITVDALFCTFPQRCPDFMRPLCRDGQLCEVDLRTNQYNDSIFVIGDASHTIFPKIKKPQPKTAEFAYLMGQYVGIQLLFRYTGKGTAPPPPPPRRVALWVVECGPNGQGVQVGPDVTEILQNPTEGEPKFFLETIENAADKKGDWVDGYIYKFYGKQFPRFTQSL